MPTIARRRLLLIAGAAAALHAMPASLRAQGHQGMYSRLREPGMADMPHETAQQWSVDSPAPRARDFGRWEARAPLPLPRSEMAWATAWANRLHVIGGYGMQRVSNAYHHIYDPVADRWTDAAPIPRPGNHVGVVATAGLIYGIGGHAEQNRSPYADCFVYDVATDRWRRIAPLPAPRGAISVVALGGRIHAIGGAIGEDNASKKSVAWHDVYDPTADRWQPKAPLPLGRDHMGAVVTAGRIHVIGGRIDSAAQNVDDHDVYDPTTDRWETRARMPTGRSGHGAVLYRGRIFVMGGEEFVFTPASDGSRQLGGRVFGQMESYDPATDSWHHHAPMPTPRHGLGAAVIGNAIHVAGGGPVVGGGVQSAIHEAFNLG